jgi:3-oxoacyl-[acyl-carrier protein] reductase
MTPVALITGASRGIGKAVAIKLSQMGFHVLLNYRSNDAEAAQTLQQVQAQGGSGDLLKYDVADKAATDAVLGGWLETHTTEKIAVLVNNAGTREDTMMMWMQEAQWRSVVDVNLNGFFYTTQKVLNQMLVNKYGRIINMVSLSGLKGLPGQVNYSTAKAGLIGATKALAQEVARRKVTVNAVAPGFIKTDMTKDLNEQELAAMVPLQRFGEAEEVAELVAFLASDKAAYITGQVISINGGLY